MDGDGDVTLDNFALFFTFMGGPGATPPPGGEAADLDGDVDLGDFAAFQRQFTGGNAPR